MASGYLVRSEVELERELFMNFESVKSGNLHHEYRIIFSAEEVEQGIVDAVSKYAKTFKMQGFRPGHVPLNIVRNNVEERAVKEALDALVSRACSDVLKQLGAKDLASKPTFRFEKQYEKDQDVEIALTIELAPDFELKPYDMKLEKLLPTVTDDDVVAARLDIMTKFPIREKADDKYKAKHGDLVVYKATCYNKGKEDKKKGFEDRIALPEKIPDDAEFLLGFIGKKAGDTFDFTPATDKDTVYKISITSIEKALKKISPEEYVDKRSGKNLKEFDEELKEQIEKDVAARAFLYHKNQILENIGKRYDFEMPEGVIEQEMRSVLANVKRDAERAGKKLEKTDEELRAEYSDVVHKRVLLGYVLNKIAKKENIQASEEDVKNAVLAEINENPGMASRIVEYYSKNPDALNYKRAEIIERKVIEFLISKADAKEVKKTRKEVEAIVNKLLED